MFSSKSYLERKTGPYGVGRLSYLQSLVNEYQNTDDDDAKTQIIGNLANFAYDPINYEYMKALNVLDLFLDGLEDPDDKIVEFAISGICNACNYHVNKKHIIDNGGVKMVINCLSRPSEDTVLSAITSLIYLICPETKTEIVSLPVVECMLRLSKAKNSKLKNLATIFIEDHCDPSVVVEAQKIQQRHFHIPSTVSS
ncbi:armadillo repeat-containing protein 7-like [Dreissena polymorpha]|uniref:Armadillo repeat-containing protein 7 n=1 Tax=Dreissena polymorpha TaxID=45954 RepID=A0A9D4QIY1_DREPO|nr:armadillo repeat-containing protein 7-like [Dreissena polymorpha]XP_052279990.1 armadillo repeat-containing protein 7-like [Dreissena polymorpha]XP_052279991.1 armadillo repeat-containing protein 7-like [Dreissena polymorpha]XP_052279992.1 armadillo repeat-containing protein 7-like [Dreissena polymorpha]XP_052279993.1 armadillo repeat-containing protein 7-like [Dreissena polymorpha]XP_052279994.1 armadillo repeat-containing protein 7-like [Dreissena polymorpha]XP_052279995.1 armadillo repe